MVDTEPHHQNGHVSHHERHHRTLGETLEGQDKITGAESISSSRSSTSSDTPPAAQDSTGDTTHTPNEFIRNTASQSIAYDIKLKCRSSDPVADSQNLPPEELPSHWVPTVMSQVTRATSSAFDQISSPRHSEDQQREGQKRRETKTEESHMLHRLTFQNPWEGKSFRKPGIKAVLHGGLKWGLPDSYTEGSGRGDKRASGFKSNKKIQKQLQLAKEEDTELGEGWDKVEVVEPKWGWPAGGLKHEVDEIRYEDKTEHPSQQEPEHRDGEEADYKAKEKPLQEWKDPKDPSRVAARVTWLGHASTLLQLPPLSTSSTNSEGGKENVVTRSINILFDPIFSERCSPSQSAGPQRFTPAPCTVDDLPPIDFVIISHSHYDHLDYHTFKQLHHLRGDKIHAFVPLGVKEKLTGSGGFGWTKAQVSEIDWWDSATLTLPSGEAELKIHCTPAQHGSGRGAGDKDASLWASWVVEWMSCKDDLRFCTFFAGDTGLKYHHDNPNKRQKYPACPAFAEIAAKFHPFDLLLLPISVGSSLSYFRSWDPFPRAISPFPRVSSTLTSSIHMDPHDAVECHGIFQKEKPKDKQETRPMFSLAVHYGTFVRNEEQTSADVRELRKACRKMRLRFHRVRDETCLLKGGEEAEEEAKIEGMQRKDEDAFLVADQGKTVWLPIHSSST
ncbi:related to FMP30 - mitochondrial inner membrane protein with a role in maintaining mitochondrial morphology [Ustilago trichophora]|uniref:Related to FMP30 - mitochondrial inner membrane protein with a role in maintaining mitochondrial morphology n=1 Tax=Ustilago trichophora TaxID=86804 RepID=A0A5C3EPY0_9BASI|nr:related to FMP30 - mitochondrial inner membrane protein with a role in maintaining mitochondrial morphology [Ustilago trichophora]